MTPVVTSELLLYEFNRLSKLPSTSLKREAADAAPPSLNKAWLLWFCMEKKFGTKCTSQLLQNFLICPKKISNFSNNSLSLQMTNTTPANTVRRYECCLQVQLFDYKSKTRNVERFISEMEEAMFLDQIDEHDRATKIRLLRLRCTTETKELLPDMGELTYEQYKSALIDLFPPVPPAVFMMEYISYKVLPSEESFTKLRELADRAYKNKPVAEKKASVILRLMEAFSKHENVWTYLSQSHTDTTISTIISEVSRMALLNKDRKFKLQSNVSCDHCMISGHIASQCRRKQSGLPQGDYRKKPTPNPTVSSNQGN
uniref:CCHC-type domain-containing protein n=1 Tax=Strongyloides papillosus TaxID=174720 RepID=A0A0N5B5Y8_STREA